MKINLIIIVSLILFSCSEDCSKCQQKLEDCLLSAPLPVNLSKNNAGSYESTDSTLVIGVSAEDKYLYDNQEYSLEEITSIIDVIMNDIVPSERKLKIAGDKMAHYEAIFALITHGKEKGYKPILTFSNEESN